MFTRDISNIVPPAKGILNSAFRRCLWNKIYQATIMWATLSVWFWSGSSPCRSQWHCLKQNCSYINYNPDSDQCEIGLGQCEFLAPTVGVMVNVYWQLRDVCLQWGCYQETGWVAFGTGSYRPDARIKHGEALVVGKYVETITILTFGQTIKKKWLVLPKDQAM